MQSVGAWTLVLVVWLAWAHVVFLRAFGGGPCCRLALGAGVVTWGVHTPSRHSYFCCDTACCMAVWGQALSMCTRLVTRCCAWLTQGAPHPSCLNTRGAVLCTGKAAAPMRVRHNNGVQPESVCWASVCRLLLPNAATAGCCTLLPQYLRASFCTT
jgi:hypothetical protein